MCLLLVPFIFFQLLPATIPAVAPPLHPGYYAKSCPNAEYIVRDVLKKAMIREPRSGASVMRFQFHDCFVNSGGPDWEVKLGRKDSLTASQEDADAIMPSPRANATMLIDLFAKFDLSVKDLVALSGSHSIGKGRCFSIVFRLYNQSGTGRPDPSIEPKFRQKLNKLCPLGGDGNVTGDLDFTPRVFDNQYFKDLVSGRGFLNSDETLYTYWRTREYVKRYSEDQDEFFRDFVEGMIKMGDLQSGRPGEIRKNCRVVNGGPPVDLVVEGYKDRRILSYET
ncbi:hypothetical protein M8C21_009705 [Ambrosia artemisiifolia]|uniref:peroxidase n=1 Tax=Ambrosia artemisiifolia TaxID=4212 RepID=A0AAD5G1U5_AMBAR|nr:hypothetical protein M8C21_009705 [Ambrosia artemisiifolia]